MLNEQLAVLIQRTILPIRSPENLVDESQNQDLQEHDLFSDNELPIKKEKK